VSGHGDYQVSGGVNPKLNAVLRGLGGAGSSLLGFGPSVGSELADSAHRLFKSVTGYGDYKVKNNTLITDNGAPIFKPEDRVMHIRHREFVTDVYSGPDLDNGATKFNTYLKYAINPANPGLFPWLSTIARNFQQFRFRGLLFSFESKSGYGVSSTNTTLGTVIIATDYIVKPSYLLPTITPFNNKQEMEAHEFCTSSIPTSNMLHPIECAPSEQLMQHHNVVVKRFEEREDIKFYYPCMTQISTVGMQKEKINLGELWVSYDIELLKTRKDDTKASSHYFLNGTYAGGYFPPIVVNKYVSPQFTSIDLVNGRILFDTSFYGSVTVTFNTSSVLGGITTYVNVLSKSNTITDDKEYLNDTTSAVAASNVNTSISQWKFYVQGGGYLQLNSNYCSTADCVLDIHIDSAIDDFTA
jgi:hypothetical protein